jgi:hypothetical protein
MLYYFEGEALTVGDRSINSHSAITCDASLPVVLENLHESITTEVLMLQGRPINEVKLSTNSILSITFSRLNFCCSLLRNTVPLS